MVKTWDQSKADRETGMAHAEEGQEDWMEEAVNFTVRCLNQFGKRRFMTEDIVDLARGNISNPRDGRAWGPVMKRVERMGYIVNVGFAPTRTSNTSPKVQWAAVEHTTGFFDA